MSVAAIVVAAGEGRRMGGVPKAFIQLAGEPLLRHALRPFLADARVTSVVVALRAADASAPPDWLTTLDARIRIVPGGETRARSVTHALDAARSGAEVAVVHDAARPLVTSDIVSRVIDAGLAGQCVTVGVPLADTIHEVDGEGRISRTPDRARLRCAQTPQAFPLDVLRSALVRAAADGLDGTDEAGIVSHYGTEVRLLAGDPSNLKITEPTDLIVAESLLAERRDAPASIP